MQLLGTFSTFLPHMHGRNNFQKSKKIHEKRFLGVSLFGRKMALMVKIRRQINIFRYFIKKSLPQH
jgi:hypothetical protein